MTRYQHIDKEEENHIEHEKIVAGTKKKEKSSGLQMRSLEGEREKE